jgi:hypothetical protein
MDRGRKDTSTSGGTVSYIYLRDEDQGERGTVREPAETHTPITKHQRSAHDQQSDKVAYYTIILDPIE